MSVTLFGFTLDEQQLGMLALIIQIIATVASGALIFLRAIVFPFFRRSPMLGRWYSYNSSTFGGQAAMSPEVWKIRRKIFSLRGELIIVAQNTERDELRYFGDVHFDQDANHIIAEFRRRGNQEKYTFRFRNTSEPNPTTPLLGVWIGRDHDETLTAGMVLVDRKPYQHEEVRRIWSDNLIPDNDEHVFRLEQTYRLATPPDAGALDTPPSDTKMAAPNGAGVDQDQPPTDETPRP